MEEMADKEYATFFRIIKQSSQSRSPLKKTAGRAEVSVSLAEVISVDKCGQRCQVLKAI